MRSQPADGKLDVVCLQNDKHVGFMSMIDSVMGSAAVHFFTSGRGTPYGLADCPVIKVATRRDLARRWHDLMDLNAGSLADGDKTIADVGWQLFRLMLAVASGQKTWAEQQRNALVLFNPAPVTCGCRAGRAPILFG